LAAGLAFCVLNALYLTVIRNQAVKAVSAKLKAIPLYLRKEDEKLVEHELKSSAYKHALPFILSVWIK